MPLGHNGAPVVNLSGGGFGGAGYRVEGRGLEHPRALRVETIDGGRELFMMNGPEQVTDRIRRALRPTDEP